MLAHLPRTTSSTKRYRSRSKSLSAISLECLGTIQWILSSSIAVLLYSNMFWTQCPNCPWYFSIGQNVNFRPVFRLLLLYRTIEMAENLREHLNCKCVPNKKKMTQIGQWLAEISGKRWKVSHFYNESGIILSLHFLQCITHEGHSNCSEVVKPILYGAVNA